MKKQVILIVVFSLAVFKYSLCQNSVAVVSKVQGLYIFTDNEPLAEYEVVGEVTTAGHNDNDIKNSGAQYQTVRDYLIKTARQANYTSDGLILSLVNGGTDKAVMIKFKESAQNKERAKVTQYQGVYVFVDCSPLTETKYLGTVKSKTSLSSSQYTSLRDKLIKKCKTEFPEASGLLIKFVTGGTDTGDAVVFK